MGEQIIAKPVPDNIDSGCFLPVPDGYGMPYIWEKLYEPEKLNVFRMELAKVTTVKLSARTLKDAVMSIESSQKSEILCIVVCWSDPYPTIVIFNQSMKRPENRYKKKNRLII